MNRTHNLAIVDDEPGVHTIFKARFRKEVKAGLLKLHHFYNGQECYDALKGQKLNEELDFGFIILDINMPIMDGFTLLKIIKTEYPSFDVCMCSAYADEDYVSKARSLGAIDFLVKPLNFKEMKKIVYEKFSLTLEGDMK